MDERGVGVSFILEFSGLDMNNFEAKGERKEATSTERGKGEREDRNSASGTYLNSPTMLS